MGRRRRGGPRPRTDRRATSLSLPHDRSREGLLRSLRTDVPRDNPFRPSRTASLQKSSESSHPGSSYHSDMRLADTIGREASTTGVDHGRYACRTCGIPAGTGPRSLSGVRPCHHRADRGRDRPDVQRQTSSRIEGRQRAPIGRLSRFSLRPSRSTPPSGHGTAFGEHDGRRSARLRSRSIERDERRRPASTTLVDAHRVSTAVVRPLHDLWFSAVLTLSDRSDSGMTHPRFTVFPDVATDHIRGKYSCTLVVTAGRSTVPVVTIRHSASTYHDTDGRNPTILSGYECTPSVHSSEPPRPISNGRSSVACVYACDPPRTAWDLSTRLPVSDSTSSPS